MVPGSGKCIKLKNAFIYKKNFQVHIWMHRIYYGSAPVHTLDMSMSFGGVRDVCVCCIRFVGLFLRERERQRGCVGVCVSTCYIIERVEAECAALPATLQWE